MWAFNTACSKTEIEHEWRAVPANLRAFLCPFRNDAQGYPAVRHEFRGHVSIIDIALIRAVSGDDLLKATQFVASELEAFKEGVLFYADRNAA